MGSSKAPKAPPAPNPYQVAGAQTGSNISTAIANAYMGNASESGPLGSVRYNTGNNKFNKHWYYTQNPDVRASGMDAFEHWQKYGRAEGRAAPPDYAPDIEITDPTTGQTYKIPQFTRQVTLSPAQQRLLDQQNKLGGQLNDMAINQSQRLASHLSNPINLDGLPAAPNGVKDVNTNGLPELRGLTANGLPDITQDMEGYRGRTEDALMSRMDRQLERDRGALDSKLANQGITMGSKAWKNAQGQFGENVNDARNQVFLASGNESRAQSAEQRARRGQLFEERSTINNDTRANRGQLFNERIGVNNDARQNRGLDMGLRERALQERMLMRNQPINEITALMNGGQVSIPQFSQFNPGTVAPTPVGDYIYQTAGLQRQDAQTAGQQNAAFWNTAGNIAGGLFKLSDMRTKTDARYVYTDEKGYEWFMFRYNGWDIPSFGVMAQQVLEINPEAVAVDPCTGFFMVNYGAL